MLFTDVFSAQSAAVRVGNEPSNNMAFLGKQFFPMKRKTGIDLKYIKTRKGLGVALKPSALDSQATIRTREGFKVVSEQMPLFRESMMITEKDLAEIQRAKEANDPYLMEVLNNIYDDVANLVSGAEISAERMRMNLLAPVDGKSQIVIGMSDNTLYNYNYDPDGEWKKTHYLEVTGTDTWDKPDSSSPLSDVQHACEVLTGIGVAPTYAIMNSDTVNMLMENEQIQKLNAVRQFGISTGFMDKDTAKRIFTASTGLTILEYNKQYKDYDGKSYKYFPDGYVSIVGADALGFTYSGVTAEERTLMGDSKVDVAVLENGIAIATQTIYGPPVQYSTTAAMIALPSFEGMDSLFTIKVK